MGNNRVAPLLAGRLVNMSQVVTKALTRMRAVARPLLKSLGIPNRWARAYLRCLSYERSGTASAVLIFDPAKGSEQDRFFAKVIETGVEKGGIDMKPWFQSRGPTNIPIIHTRKSIKGMVADKAGSMAEVVRQISGMQPGQRAPARLVHKLLPAQHASDPLAQTIRQQQAFVNANGGKRGRKGSITGFRRLSPTPPEDASSEELARWKQSWYWMREGFEGKQVMDKLRPIFAETVRECLAAHIRGD